MKLPWDLGGHDFSFGAQKRKRKAPVCGFDKRLDFTKMTINFMNGSLVVGPNFIFFNKEIILEITLTMQTPPK